MTIIQKIAIFTKKKLNYFSLIDVRALHFQKLNPLILISFLIIFSVLFFVSSNLMQKKKNENANNLIEITKNREFSSLTNFLISKINSPF